MPLKNFVQKMIKHFRFSAERKKNKLGETFRFEKCRRSLWMMIIKHWNLFVSCVSQRKRVQAVSAADKQSKCQPCANISHEQENCTQYI